MAAIKAVDRIFCKKTLYILCFLALNLIEVLRATQTGDVWYVAVNCTGLVVMVMVVSAWPLRDFLTWGNAIYTVCCAIAMIVIGLRWEPNGRHVLWQIETAVMNVWWIAIVGKSLLGKIRRKEIVCRPGLLGWLWIILSLLMTFSASQRIWPLWFLLMFGIFYLTPYCREDRKALLDAMIDGTILSFFCIQIYAYGFRPYDEVRYKGAYSNCNCMALYYLIVFMMCLFKLHLLEMKKANKGWKLFYLLGAGGLLSFQLFTICRTAWIASAVLVLCYGILVVRKIWGKSWGQVLLRGFMLMLMVMVTFLPVYYSIRWLPTVLHHPIWHEGEYSISKVHSFDPADSEKYVELDEALKIMFNRLVELVDISTIDPFLLHVKAQESEYHVEVQATNIPWLGHSFNVRLSIYKAYLEHLNWLGHNPQEDYFWIQELDGRLWHAWHAQNLWIQIAYSYGIPAGFLMIVVTCTTMCVYLKRLKCHENSYAIMPWFVCLTTFLFGLTEIVWNPGQLIMFLFFFIQIPQTEDILCLHQDNDTIAIMV